MISPSSARSATSPPRTPTTPRRRSWADHGHLFHAEVHKAGRGPPIRWAARWGEARSARGVMLCARMLMEKLGRSVASVTVAREGHGQRRQRGGVLLHPARARRWSPFRHFRRHLQRKRRPMEEMLPLRRAGRSPSCPTAILSAAAMPRNARLRRGDPRAGGVENAISRSNAGNVSAKFIIEGANWPHHPGGGRDPRGERRHVVPALANAGGVVVSHFRVGAEPCSPSAGRRTT